MWDDSDMGDNVGGRCLNSWQASRRMKAGRGDYEEVVVHLSFDEHISGALRAVKPRCRPSSRARCRPLPMGRLGLQVESKP